MEDRRFQDWDEKLSMTRSSVRTIISRLGPAYRIYIGLYDVIITSFYAAFLLSTILLIIYIYYYFRIPLIEPLGLKEIVQLDKVEVIIQFIDNIFNSFKEMIETYLGKGEPISRIDLLILMATTLSISAGFYGVATQLYSEEWGGWIMFRRAFVYIRRTPSVCRSQKDAMSKPVSAKYAENLVDVLFPTRRHLFALSYDQVIIASLLIAVIHFIGVVAIGSSAALASALEILIFSFILGGSLLLVILSLIVRPPLAVFVSQLAVRGPLLHYGIDRGCLSVSLGLRSLMERRILFIFLTFLVIISGLLLYIINPINVNLTTPGQLGVGVILYFGTIVGLAVLLGIVNEERFHRSIRAFIDLKNKINKNIYNNICKRIKYRYCGSAYKGAIIILLILFELVPVFMLFYIYKLGLPFEHPYLNYITIIIVKIWILIAVLMPVFYLSYTFLARRKTHMDFGFYVNYAEQMLEMLKSSPGQGPPRPILLLEILAVETILSLMVTVSAVLKTFEEDLIRMSVLKRVEGKSDPYRSVVEEVRQVYNISVENDPRIWLEPRESSSRFFTPMGDLDSYFAHVDNLVSTALPLYTGERKGEYLEGLLVLSVIMASIGLIGAARMGRIRSSTYPRALFRSTGLLLRIRRTMHGVDEKMIQQIESIIPDLLATLVIVTRLFPSSVCHPENMGAIVKCFDTSFRLQDRHYCCQIVTMTILPCFEDPEIKSRYKNVTNTISRFCPGVLPGDVVLPLPQKDKLVDGNARDNL